MVEDALKSVAEMAEQLATVAAHVEEVEAETKAGDSSPTRRGSTPSRGAIGPMRETMGLLDDQTRRILKFSAVIEEIADATANLLALNASIEAARAGGHGRRFAVLAEGTGVWPTKPGPRPRTSPGTSTR